MKEKNQLKLIGISFVTSDGKEIDESELTEEQYQKFADDFELARLKYNVRWPEFDNRYMKKKETVE
ncbi:hypothetical protein GGQ84_000178 [Desulfitispora alkaliphila]|uniref:hypothetical protein n=1 Tax=Desulfitispora alkaliphila TaxID=622674 RepID=UPI003D24CA81